MRKADIPLLLKRIEVLEAMVKLLEKDRDEWKAKAEQRSRAFDSLLEHHA
jgi:hypothetical protein